MKNAFGKLIKKRLIDLEMTQLELAQKVGVDKNYLNSIIVGRRAGYKYKDKICSVLNIDFDYRKVG